MNIPRKKRRPNFGIKLQAKSCDPNFDKRNQPRTFLGRCQPLKVGTKILQISMTFLNFLQSLFTT